MPISKVKFSDFDTRVLADFFRIAGRGQRVSETTVAETDQILIERLHLMDGNYLKRAAVLLFHPDPERFVTGAYIKVGFFETDADLLYHDKLMAWNPGQLPADWTIKQLMEKHASLPYNPDIANTFFRAGMVESRGRGIERIMEACTRADIPEPDLRYEKTGLWVVFFSSLNRVGEKLTLNQERILLLLRHNPYLSARELSAHVGISGRKIEQNIAKLKKSGILKRIGPAKGGHREVSD